MSQKCPVLTPLGFYEAIPCLNPSGATLSLIGRLKNKLQVSGRIGDRLRPLSYQPQNIFPIPALLK
jgi:hypothetical protein